MSQDYTLIAVLAILALTSCGNASTTPETMTDTYSTTSETPTSAGNASTIPGTTTVSPSTETTETTVFATTTTTTTTTPFPSTDAPQVDSMCPGGDGQFGTNYIIVVDRTNYTGLVWVRPSDDRYVVTCNPNCSPVAGYSATMNTTHSTLTIDSIRDADAGTWKIADATIVDAIPVEVCQLTAVQVPQCSISSDEDTDSLEPGTQLTLTVDITGYYCSVETGFDLTTGDVTEDLGIRHNVSDVTNITVTTNFSVDITRLGDVTLDFICDGRRPLTCGGVKRLLKSPPQCIIRSDKYTASLETGTNLTLVVDIKSFYCPRQAGILLATGGITKTLRQYQTMDDIMDLNLQSNFLVTTDRFGDVSVSLMCGNITTTLTCGGVNKLSEAATITSTAAERSTSTETPNSSPGNTAAGASTTRTTEGTASPGPTDNTTGLAVGLTVLGVIIIVIIVLVRYRRRVGEYFLSRRQNLHDAELKSEENPKEKHTTVSFLNKL